MSGKAFLVWLGQQLANVIMPLVEGISDPDHVSQFFKDYGWDIPASSLSQSDVAALQKLFAVDAQSITDSLPDPTLTDTSQLASAFFVLIGNLAPIIASIPNLSSGASSSGVNLPVSVDWSEISGELIPSLIVNYLESYQPVVAAALLFLGVIEEEATTPGGLGRTDYIKKSIRWERFSKLVGNPRGLMIELYGWDASSSTPPNTDLILTILQRSCEAFGVSVASADPTPTLRDALAKEHLVIPVGKKVLHIPIIGGTGDGGKFELSLLVAPVGAQTSANADGVLLTTEAIGNMSTSFDLKPFAVTIKGGFESDGAVKIHFQPGRITPILSAGSTKLDAGILGSYKPDSPAILIGGADSSRLEFSELSAGIGASAIVDSGGNVKDVELSLNIGLKGAKIVIDFSDADSFATQAVGSAPQEITFGDVGVSWSSKSGLTFKGSASLEAVIVLRRSLGPFSIDTLTIKVAPQDSNLTLALVVSGSIQLGPLTAVIDKIGFKFIVKPHLIDASQKDVTKSGPLALEFKPPNGIALDLDTEAVSGGGYLYYDDIEQRYAGAVELEVSGVGLDAYGILDTKMPDGSKGFSLLVIVHAHFPSPGIQIGFGVSISGVGGLAGINRAMVLSVLEQDVKNHTIQDILFPEDPVANAPQIISSLSSMFPVEPGEFVFGPMAELSWGEGGIITGDIGIFVELPKSLKIALLGKISASLPPDEPIVDINVDIIGVYDSKGKTLFFEAILYDSTVADFALTGGTMLFADWGDQPIFIFSMGGFNPAWQPPPNLPDIPDRLQLSLCDSDDPRINLSCYLAITSNTFQVGALLDLYVGIGKFYAKGYLGFDALIILKPLSFNVGISAGIVIGIKPSTVILSITLQATLTGPQPWQLDGTVSFTFLFFGVTLPIHVSAGSQAPPASYPNPTLANLLSALQTALENNTAWSSAQPADGLPVVLFKQPTPSNAQASQPQKPVYVDPATSLTVTQTTLPLGEMIEQFNNLPMDNPASVNISDVTVDGQKFDTSPVTGNIAMGPFKILTDDQMLSRASFETKILGKSLGSHIVQGSSLTTPAQYDTKFIDSTGLLTPSAIPYTVSGQYLKSSTTSAMSQESRLLDSGPRKFVSRKSTVQVSDPSYAVVSTDDLSPLGMPPGQKSVPQSQAYALKASYDSQNPSRAGMTQVIRV